MTIKATANNLLIFILSVPDKICVFCLQMLIYPLMSLLIF
ncbi:hypothetical protein AmaxDRAFT_2980 [Limnospira maxima CS-328]|uniref:Uncharacterized protein n=1 Tax=Limnospira maxima CS-328 TaxID=513049 RepID=B5W2I6_LIMMA|nr:hypothetical protein AmaxDRAFT_2980 [Limnospira maxima CS-328]